MRSVARAAAALLLVGVTAALGVVAVGVPSAVAVVPNGGCWTYVPDPLDPALGAPPASDISTALEPWSVEDGQIVMGTSGATTTGGTREVVVGLSSGPVVSAAAASGTASFVLSVDGTPLAAPLTTTYAAEAGQPVRDVVVRGSLPVGAVGNHVVRLDSVYFDDPAQDLRVACNGQTQGAPGGPNPAADPVPTDVTAPYSAVAASRAGITGVTGQRVTTAARAGDVVTVAVAGFPSSAPAQARLCSGDDCTDESRLWAGQSGTGQTVLTVTEDLAAGAGSIQVSDGVTTATHELTVLGPPALAAAEKPATDTTTVELTGTSWDPEKPVTVRGYTGSDASSPTTSDPAVSVKAGPSGGFTASFEVSDPDTETIAATQDGGTLSAGYAFSGQIGTAPIDPVDPVDPPVTPVDPPVAAPVAPPASDPVVPPADIPPPEDLPIEDVPGLEPTEVSVLTEDLSVSEARLAGNATLAELFGGAVRRDLLFIVANLGDATVTDPIVRVSVGRSPDIEPQIVDADVGVLDPGEQTVVSVPLELPMASFGTYHVVGQVGDAEVGSFDLEWTTYPWGLFALNALGAALIVWGVRRRMEARKPAPYRPTVAAGAEDAVVDLTAAEAWWSHRDGTPGVRPGPGAGPVEEPADDAIVDLGAAESWWSRRAAEKGSQAS
ncbi:MAG: hypothetical protein WBP61_18865 [Nocardioides sp.]